MPTAALRPPVGPARRRAALGAVVSVGLVAGLSALLLPLRPHIGVATAALVLVVPVVVGAAAGGVVAGAVAAVVGFVAYDLVFIPPYYTLSAGTGEDYAALGVYAVVMVVVTRVVAHLDAAREEATARAGELRRLFDVGELLVRDASVAALLDDIVVAVCAAFELAGAALLLPSGGTLELVASAGAELADAELRQLSRGARVDAAGDLRTVALVASGRPVGLLALRARPGAAATSATSSAYDDGLLRAFANQTAIALERAQLQEQAVRGSLLEEVDRLRRGLVGAVSHDLRTPLSTIKVSTSALLDPDAPVTGEDARELLELIDGQADRLDRLVGDLLDMTRIEAGALEVRRRPVEVTDLLAGAEARLGALDGLERLGRDLPPDLPPVDVDPVLIGQALANLVDNAVRYSPASLPVVVAASVVGDRVRLSVSDGGPGPSAVAGPGLWGSIGRRPAGGGGGLGLAIVAAFVEVHGESVWVEAGDGGGSRVVLTLPVAERA